MKGRGGTKEVWLTSLILFPHTDAFQIDLHTAQCPFSLGLAIAGALECKKPAKKTREKQKLQWGIEGAKQKKKTLNCRIRDLPSLTSLALWKITT